MAEIEDAAPEITHPADFWEASGQLKQITLRLVMEKSLTQAELREYDNLPEEGALERAQALKTIHLEWLGIGEIAGLEPFESAEVLYLQANLIERIDGLDCLPRLQFLALQSNRITNVENLLCLTELEFLDLSKNRIAELDVKQLPQKINMLNFRENPCTKAADYQSRLQAHLPDLYTLDGVDIGEEVAAQSTAPTPATDVDAVLSATEQGLGAYWKRNDLHAGLTADMQDSIQAYSMESLADADLSRRVEEATARSRARRSAQPLPTPLACDKAVEKLPAEDA
eukprot:TRINITY_DN108244_c0_g1_i1.p1 TRINITY_DN108244_c0_g1~~TRINITY_DN108244_c0_g1_i1.p1  ORF type:complete len:294 (-),score=58.80 TRINITY_DN108244_c0_g1_i1:180-1031(-)